MKIECPYCRDEIELSDHIDDYEWENGYAIEDMTCPECRSELHVEMEAVICNVEVSKVAKSGLIEQAEYEAYCENRLDYEREMA